MKATAPTTDYLLAQRNNGQVKPYQFADSSLATMASLAKHSFDKLKLQPEPPQNPNGLRQIDKRAELFTETIIPLLSDHRNVRVVDQLDAATFKTNCPSEDGKLLLAAMSFPTYLDWGAPINKQEQVYNDEKPDRLTATYQAFGQMLRILDYGAGLMLIRPQPDLTESVFTPRDQIITVDGHLISANMFKPSRKGEARLVKTDIKPPEEVLLEGGNVILGKDVVFVGINAKNSTEGERTNMEAAEWLQQLLGTSRKVIALPLSEGTLHLDCVFCPLEETNGKGGAAIVFKAGFKDPHSLELLNSIYPRLRGVSALEKSVLGPNVLKLDRKTVIANPEAPKLIGNLVAYGMDVTLIPYGQITRADGAYRCTYSDLQREN